MTLGSKQVANRTLELRARTAEWLRTSTVDPESTAVAPNGISSPPDTWRAMTTVGLSNSLCWMVWRSSTTKMYPEASAGEIICHLPMSAISRIMGSRRCIRRDSANPGPARITSSVKSLMVHSSHPHAAPICSAVGCMRTRYLSAAALTTYTILSSTALASKAQCSSRAGSAMTRRQFFTQYAISSLDACMERHRFSATRATRSHWSSRLRSLGALSTASRTTLSTATSR
mmetsp:Transcript_21996/g.41983  ORF Transcript_21996/g.41983 Transcript_21996/m.41983 type:complete len:230 (+) Transcript_21996:1599-2288(+)